MTRSLRLSGPISIQLALLLGASVARAAEPPRAIIVKIAPSYPELARRMHLSGTVTVRVSIAPDGTVTRTQTESGHGLLAPAAIEAIRRWRFAPAPEQTDTLVGVTFTENSK